MAKQARTKAEQQQQNSVEGTRLGRGHDAASPKALGMPGSYLGIPALQRAAGNRAVSQLLQTSAGKGLRVDQPGDRYEREADQVTKQVLTPELSLQEEIGDSQQSLDTHLQRQAREAETRPVRERPRRTSGSTPHLESSTQAPGGRGQRLSEPVRTFFERRFNHDFSQVRVHRDAHAERSAEALNARAYTVGQDIVFGAGEYAPRTQSGELLLAHELAHVTQAPDSPPSIRRLKDERSDPTRFEKIHESLFVEAPSARGSRLPWVNAKGSDRGTAGLIIKQFKSYLKELAKRRPRSLFGTVPKLSKAEEPKAEAAIDAAAELADERLHKRFPFVPKRVSTSELRAAVKLITPKLTSSSDFLRQWLTNRLIKVTDVENYEIEPDDPRFQDMLTELLTDKFAGPHIRTLASRQAAFIEEDEATKKHEIFLHPRIDPAKRLRTLIHEITHFHAHPAYQEWVESTTNRRFFNEGFTEYLARLAMTKEELAGRKSYEDRWKVIKDEVGRYVSDDDIARAFFLGEVWRLEALSEVSRRIFKEQVGLAEGKPRREEVAKSRTGPGINQIVRPSVQFRFMNLGVNQSAPKLEHVRFFVEKIYDPIVAGDSSVRLRFVGHASAPGSARHNLWLSRRRAAAFYRMARVAGVPESQLLEADKPPHHGEERPTAEGESVHTRAFNRRVELFLIRDTKPRELD